VVPFCSTEMFEKVRKLSSVLKNIPGDIKPRQNQTEKIEIGIYMALNSMQDYVVKCFFNHHIPYYNFWNPCILYWKLYRIEAIIFRGIPFSYFVTPI
jgi:hypothetical protein